MIPCTAVAATALLIFHKAPERLLRRNELALEATELLLEGYRSIGCWSEYDGSPRVEPFLDEEKVRIGVILSRVGEIEHPAEFDRPSGLHDLSGSRLLMSWGATSDLSGFCYAYSWWESCEELSVEHYTAVLADLLWRGERDPEFEDDAIRVITERATGEATRFVDWKSALSKIFTDIAAGGLSRLARSHIPEPTPEQCVRVLRILGEWTKRGWWYQVNRSLAGGAVVDYTNPADRFASPKCESFGVNPFDALCQATTVMQVLLEEHPEKP